MKRLFLIIILIFTTVCISFAQGNSNFSDNNTGSGSDASDTPSPNSPTTLSDGTADAGGCADPVLANGNWYNTESDISYVLFGDEFKFERTYNSLSEFNRSFGDKWSHNFDMHLLKRTNGDIHFISDKGRLLLLRKQKNSREYYPLRTYCPRLTHKNDNTFELLFADGRMLYFNSKGKLTKIESIGGNETTFTYDNNDNLTKITDPTGRGFELKNSSYGKITEIKDHTGRTVQYKYDNENRLTEVILPDGLSRKYGYGKRGYLTSLTNQNGNNYQFFFDKQGRMTKNVDGRGNFETFKYPKFLGIFPQRKMVFYDKRGKQWISKYNQSGKITEYGFPNGTKQKQKWDKYDNLVEILYPNGTKEIMEYDERNNRTLFTDRMGQSAYYTYHDKFNLVTSYTDVLGNKTALEYDSRGNLIKRIDALGNTYTYTYNGFNLITSVQDPLGQTVTLGYDKYGNLTNIIYPIGEERLTYDDLGNIISATDANGHTYLLEYDVLNRPIAMTNPKGDITQMEYGTHGEISKIIDANGNETLYDYIVLSGATDINEIRRISQIKTALNTTLFTYDEIGNLLSFTNGEGHITKFAYNAMSSLTSETNPLGETIQYNYDNLETLIERINAAGQPTSYIYDKLNRLARKTYDGNTDYYTYNSLGNIIEASNNNIHIFRKYDALQRLTEEHITTWNKITKYEYDAVGKRTAMIDPDKGVTTYKYNSNYSLTEIKNPLDEITSFEYDVAGRLNKQINANGSFSVFTYDKANYLVKLSNQLTKTETSSSYAYNYDKVGNRLSMQYANGKTDQYTYDDLYQITNVNYGDGTQEKYQYDLAGNRLSFTENKANITYEYNAANRIQKADNTTFVHDKNGNLIEKSEAGKITKYTYNGESRLIKVSLSDGKTITYDYDPFGRRTQKTVNNAAIKYLYDGINLLKELDNIGKTITHYTTGFGIDQVISLHKDNQSYFYHKDGLGSITGVSNKTKELVNQYAYNVFGKLKNSKQAIKNNFAFTGREYEEESDLVFLRGRFYDDEIGRFINEDYIRFNGGMNLFAYTGNNPVNFVDPLGLCDMVGGVIIAAEAGLDDVSNIIIPSALPQAVAGVASVLSYRQTLDAALNSANNPNSKSAAKKLDQMIQRNARVQQHVRNISEQPGLIGRAWNYIKSFF